MPKTTAERLAILETKVTTIEQDVQEIKQEVQKVKLNLDTVSTGLIDKLDQMRLESTAQHRELAGKVTDIEKTRDRGVYIFTGAAAVIAFLLGQTELASRLLELLH